jgi:hypothetical protein
MTIEEIIWDIMEIKKALEDDSDMEELWVFYKLNHYRAIHIVNEYNLTNEIDPVWLQRIHKFDWIKTTAADDPAIVNNSITLGKYKIPRTIKLKEDIGTYRISGSSNINQFEYCDFNRLILNAELNQKSEGYAYYSKIGDNIYIYPYIMQGSAHIIAENPMDIQINDNGVLKDMTFADDYPLDPSLAQKVILDFLTKDLAISDGTITDIINDSQNQFKVLKDEQK